MRIPPVSPLHALHVNPSVGSPGEDYKSRVERYAHAERELLFLSAGPPRVCANPPSTAHAVFAAAKQGRLRLGGAPGGKHGARGPNL